DKGHPEGCVVYATHTLYTPEAPEIESRCKAGTLGCVECKNRLVETLNAGLEPIRVRRAEWAGRMARVREIVHTGSTQAAATAAETMRDVRAAIHLRGDGRVAT